MNGGSCCAACSTPGADYFRCAECEQAVHSPLICGAVLTCEQDGQFFCSVQCKEAFDDEETLVCDLRRVSGPRSVAGAMPYHRAAAIFLPRGQEDSSPWSRYNMLLVPLHIDDNHWACITIQAAIPGPTQIMQLKIYDSLSTRGGRAAAKALAATLQAFMESTGWKGPVTVEAADCPQQPVAVTHLSFSQSHQ